MSATADTSTATTTKQRPTIMRELDELANQEGHLSGAQNLSEQVDATFEDDDRERLQRLTDSVKKAGGFPIVGDYEDSGERRKKRNAAQREQHNRIYVDGDDGDNDDDVQIIDGGEKSGEIDDPNDVFSPELRIADPDRSNPTKMFSLANSNQQQEKRRRLIHKAATNDTPLGYDDDGVDYRYNTGYQYNDDDSPLRSKDAEGDATEIVSMTPVNTEKVRRQTAQLQKHRADLRTIQQQRNAQVANRNLPNATSTPTVKESSAIAAIDSMCAVADAKIESELNKLAAMLAALRDLENTRTQLGQFAVMFGSGGKHEQKK